MQKIIVATSSLSAGRNMSAQIEFIQRVTNFGADLYHFDVMDGVYVPRVTVDHTYIPQLAGCSTLLIDAHLMVQNVKACIKKYLKSAAGIISVHCEVFENINDLVKIIKKIKKAGKLASVAVDLNTEVSVIEPVLNLVDMVLIMTVKAGAGGQAFEESALEKIKWVRQKNKDVLIEVDGGINPETGALCVKAGADILVSGNFIYNNDAYEAIEQLHKCTLKK